MASCFCGKSAARGRFVKLVFPSGRVELLDQPVLAAEVMARHPRFCVARPDVFREPAGAVAAPDAMLHLGRKYFVVPKSTVRRLIKCSYASSSSHSAGGGRGGGVSLRRHLAMTSGGGGGGHDGRGYKVGGKKQHKWFSWSAAARGEAKPPSPEEGGSRHGGEADAAKEVDHAKDTRGKAKGAIGGSPGRRRRRRRQRLASPGDSASYSWQPSLHSITEE